MATHSGTLAWRIPWTEEPGGLQSMGSQSRTERITLGILRENNTVLSWKAFYSPLNFHFLLFPLLRLSWEKREVDGPA